MNTLHVKLFLKKYVDLSAREKHKTLVHSQFLGSCSKKNKRNVRMLPTQEQPLLGLKGRRAWPFQSGETGDKVTGIFSVSSSTRGGGEEKKKKRDFFFHSFLCNHRIFYPVFLAPHYPVPLTPYTLRCSLAETFAKTLMTCLFFRTIEFLDFKRGGWKRMDHWTGRYKRAPE